MRIIAGEGQVPASREVEKSAPLLQGGLLSCTAAPPAVWMLTPSSSSGGKGESPPMGPPPPCAFTGFQQLSPASQGALMALLFFPGLS